MDGNHDGPWSMVHGGGLFVFLFVCLIPTPPDFWRSGFSRYAMWDFVCLSYLMVCLDTKPIHGGGVCREGCIGLVRNTPTKYQDGEAGRSLHHGQREFIPILRNTICQSVGLTTSSMFRLSIWVIYYIAVSVGDIITTIGPEFVHFRFHLSSSIVSQDLLTFHLLLLCDRESFCSCQLTQLMGEMGSRKASRTEVRPPPPLSLPQSQVIMFYVVIPALRA